MNKSARLLAFSVVSCSLLLVAGCSKLKARDQLNQGVESYKAAKYEDAVNHFQQAIDLDPKFYVARLYLATAYANQFIPGVGTPDNLKMGTHAIEEFQKVLSDDPANKANVVPSLKGIASIYYGMNRMQDAKDYQRKVLELDPGDPEAYYWVGVIDWSIALKNSKAAHAADGQVRVGEEEAFKDKNNCLALKKQNADIIDEGIQSLDKARGLREDYDDAMSYENLLYRRKADIECDDPNARLADTRTADEWLQKTMETKKIKAEKESRKGNGIVFDPNK